MENWEIEQQRKELIYNFYYENLKFCGCGSPWTTLKFIKDFLNTIKQKTDNYKKKDYDKNSEKYYEEYQSNIRNIFEFQNKSENDNFFSDSQDGIIQFVLYYLNKIEILEHGGSVGGSWLTEHGEIVLKALNECDNIESVFD
jgi:hypothetical protein